MATDMREVIGANLRAARERAGMTRVAVAHRVGCLTWQAIYNYERGHRFPSLMSARRLCAVYGITVDSLFREPVKQRVEQ